eukprot:scaffold1621_cov117-Cyclotella_meneghiniana.AAC.2
MSTDLHICVGTSNRKKGWFGHVVGLDKRFIHFGNFDNLPFDEDIETPPFSCFGRELKFAIHKYRENNIDKLKLMLYPCPGSSIHVLECCAFIRCGSKLLLLKPFSVGHVTEENAVCPIISRPGIHLSDLQYPLKNNTVTFDLEIHLHEDDRIMNFREECPLQQSMLNISILNIRSDQDTADISFNVKGRITNVHLAILKSMAPEFVRTLNLDEHHNSPEHVHIEDVDPDIFEKLIEFIYGGTISVTDLQTAKAIIDAADKYGVDNLKIQAEKKYIGYIDFTAENIVDELLYADAKNCMLLKEASMEFLVESMDAIIKTNSLKRLYQSESVTNEVMLAMSKRAKLE